MIQMNNITKICFLLIILLSVKIGESLIPAERYAHGSVLVNKRIYFFGGSDHNHNKPLLNQILYLDVSKPFSAENPSFEEIPNVSIPFGSAFATVLLGPKNIIYLFGGLMRDNNTGKDNFSNFNSSLHTFNLETNEWSILKTNGIEPERRKEINGVINNVTGKFYVFGGTTNLITANTKKFNEMNIFDINFSTWSKGPNAPTFPRIDYTATLLPNGIIVFIGEREGPAIIDPNTSIRDVEIIQPLLYDTKADRWVSMTTRGVPVENRYYHSAVLTPDERIIIFGGLKNNGTIGPVNEQLVVLDTKPNPFEWYIPPVTSTIPQLSLHSATLIGNYMLINFGNSSSPTTNSVFFYILDIRNFTWVKQFEPEPKSKPKQPENTPTTKTNSPTNLENSDNGKKIGIIVGIVGGSIGVIAGFLGYKFYKKRKYNHAIPTARTN